ncbi:MAG: methionine--tRNA ligase subunit beta, partial [Bacteroidales bacterium]|nr:methionine--tRNA ligase subunit beta [Bacteroidales bacterium]
ANEFLNLEGDKISTSRNWAVWVHEYEEQFPGQEDVLRYVLTANAPETKDNDFTWKDFQSRNNSELVAVFGNFVNRAVVLTHKYFGGVVPENRKPEPIDAETLAAVKPCREAMEKYIETFHFREALKEAMNMARIGNKYISDMEPWKVAKADPDRTASILYTCLQICADLAIAFEPFTPFSAEKLRDILRVGVDAGTDHRAGEGTPTENFYRAGEGKALHTISASSEALSSASLRDPARIVLQWDMLGEAELLPAGHQLGEAVLLFQKIEDSVIDAQIARLQAIKAEREAAEAAKAAAEAAKKIEPQKAEVTFDQFGAMDIRTATVLAAERVPKTDKLLKLTIDTGIDTRTIVSGIAEYYSPEDMLGRQICILANLVPRTIRGIESKGMILMAKQGDGKMRFITPQEAVVNGAQIG